MQFGAYYITNVAGSSTNQIAMTIDANYAPVIGTLYDKDARGFSWTVIPIPAADTSDNGFYLQHFRSQRFAKWDWNNNLVATVSAFDAYDSSFYFRLNNLGNGIVGINNQNMKYVFDAAGSNPGNGSQILAREWNGGSNQQWRFQSTVCFSSSISDEGN